jgi:hypothetical protein
MTRRLADQVLREAGLCGGRDGPGAARARDNHLVTTSDFEFVIEESMPVAGGVKVAGRLRRGRITAGQAGWLQERGNLAIAVGRIDVDAAPGDGSGRMVLVLRGLPVQMVAAGAVLRSRAWISDGAIEGPDARPADGRAGERPDLTRM